MNFHHIYIHVHLFKGMTIRDRFTELVGTSSKGPVTLRHIAPTYDDV